MYTANKHTIKKQHKNVLLSALEGLACLPDTFVKHLGAEHLLLIQTYGAKGTLSIWS